MKVLEPLEEGVLIQRYKRFLADVKKENGEVTTIHCPNSGSMKSCADPGFKVIWSLSDNPKRKLKGTWQWAHNGKSWIGLNTHLANAIVEEAIRDDKVSELTGYERLRREVKYGKSSRIDILLEDENRPPCYVEVKNVTLLEEASVASFPDAVTERGRKHLKELIDEVEKGNRAVMFYLVQRTDVERFVPAYDIDPAYAKALKEAIDAGVEVLAYQTEINPPEVSLSKPIPFEIRKL